MENELGALEGVGLSANEAKLYSILVKQGRMKANELAVKSGLQRRTVYDTLEQLEKKGMVGKAEISGVREYSASPPSSLLTFVDEKRDAIEKILPLLAKSYESEEKTAVSVLYGTSGIKTMLEDILSLKAEYRVYYGQLQIFDYLPKFINIFNEKRKKLRIRGKYLLLDVEQARKRAPLLPLAEIRYIEPSTPSIGVWWTYADRLVLFVLQKEPVMIFIKNSELAKTFRQSFDMIFESRAHK